jgi:hypothetical protein
MTYQSQRTTLCKTSWMALGLAALLSSGTAQAQLLNEATSHRSEQAQATQFRSKPLAALATPIKKGREVARTHVHDPQTLKLLVIAVDGTEPSYAAIQAFLDQIGIPYDTFISINHVTDPVQHPLPTLSSGPGYANYEGIVLTSGNLGYCDATGCHSTLSSADWAALDAYTAAFGVRTLSYYTLPELRYGLSYVSSVSTTTAAPVNVTLTTTGTSTFSYLKSTASIPVQNAYMYLATTTAAAGETTKSVLQASVGGVNYTVGAIHTAATGQQYLALTMDNNPYLLHSLTLNYGLFNWVTKGLFLGGRKIYLSPQVDDVFIADDLYDSTISGCAPSGFLIDPTTDLSLGCPTVRITGSDLSTLRNWQTALNRQSQTAKFRVSLAFNGIGAATSNGKNTTTDTLVSTATSLAKSFYWTSHTYDHENLDCYNAVPNSACLPATLEESNAEIKNNVTVAQQLKLTPTFDSKSMITPEVSGLANPAFISSAYSNGLRYLISDASKDGQKPLSANTGIPNALNPNILEVPRFATNIFYNADTAALNASGSEVDEYNHFYGPLGTSRLPNGDPFFATEQTYNDIINTESNNLLMNMLRYYAFPSMYHQSNLKVYSRSKSLFTDTINATIQKFEALSNLPIISLTESSIGALLQDRMAYNASGVAAYWTPAGPTGTGTLQGSITITVDKAAVITMTGVVCPSTGVTCESYGGQTIAHITVAPASPVTISSPI